MSNTSKGRGVKGSKFWMQTVVEKDELRVKLDQMIGEPLRWISPLAGADESFEEYELQHEVVCKELGIRPAEAKVMFSFWPKRQPQWDGLAISADGKTLYIVEAKAHLSELDSKLSATNPDSIRLITNSMRAVHDAYYPEGDFEVWLNQYYQLGNRLTFLRFLNRLRFGTIEKVKLVLLNFVDDFTYIPTAWKDWEEHYREVFQVMTGNETVPEDVILANYSVDEWKNSLKTKTER